MKTMYPPLGYHTMDLSQLVHFRALVALTSVFFFCFFSLWWVLCRDVFKTRSYIYDGAFLQTSLMTRSFKLLIIFVIKLQHRSLTVSYIHLRCVRKRYKSDHFRIVWVICHPKYLETFHQMSLVSVVCISSPKSDALPKVFPVKQVFLKIMQNIQKK